MRRLADRTVGRPLLAVLTLGVLALLAVPGIVLQRGQSTVFLTSASLGYGVRSFPIPPLAAGTYSVRLAATDLAGNLNRITGTLQLAAAKKRPGTGASTPTSAH